ncbi:hypothetical protein CFC21_021227 [Triticum aestivum]|uniref:DUF4220 domain-containing protein n=2 Tax=Triticum aestivum TaxID=4565 RepID=A0A9R1E9A5_WHEAT|nr:hypothetical protein CFC21_021227 [Triticum aestivum]
MDREQVSNAAAAPDSSRSITGQPEVIKIDILLVVLTVLVVLLRCLSRRRSRISHDTLGRYFLLGASAVYFSLTAYIFSILTTYMSSLDEGDYLLVPSIVLLLVVLLQFLKSNADMAALAVGAVASPTAGDDIDSQKIRPSMESLVSSLWVAGLLIYYIYVKERDDLYFLAYVDLPIFLLWALGVARMVLRFVAFQRANGSFAVGRNAKLIEGYMAQLQDQEGCRRYSEEAAVPHLIVTGEKKLDVEESHEGYRVKEDNSSCLVTLDKVWSSRLPSKVKDLCLSFSLFKCLRRRFAGYQLAEAGSSWAFHFVCNGLLGPEDDHARMFKVISSELAFACDFYYSPLPAASLGAWFAALHFFLSAIICSLTFIIIPLLLFSIPQIMAIMSLDEDDSVGNTFLLLLVLVVALVTLCVEIVEMVTSVRSNWTKISMVGHYINGSCWSWVICPCLLRCKPPSRWKDEIGQNLILKPNLPWAHMFKQIFHPRKNRYKAVVKIPLEVKDAVIRSLKSTSGQLTNSITTVRPRCSPDFTWTCYERITTSTDAILVWYIATFLFEIKCSSPTSAPTKSMVVATSLSRYCAYLVAEAPELLPNNAAWTKHRYQKVKNVSKQHIWLTTPAPIRHWKRMS